VADNATVRSSSVGGNRSANNAGTANAAKPTGLANGDVVYVAYACDISSATVWTLSGFTSIYHDNNGTGNNRTSGVLRKVITNAAGEPASYAPIGPSATVTNINIMAIAVKDAHSTPEDATSVGTLGANDFTPAAQTITPGNANGLVLSVHPAAMNNGVTGKTAGAPSTYTIVNSREEVGGGTGIGCFLECASRVTTGAAPANVWTGTADDATSEYHVFAVAVRNGQASPTVALSSPAADAITADRTPDFATVATDANADATQTQVEIRLKAIDQYDLAEGVGPGGLSGAVGGSTGVAQSFVGDGRIARTVRFILGKVGAPTGNFTVNIYGLTGTPGSTAVPDGVVYATETIDVSTLPGTAVEIAITWANAYAPAAGDWTVGIEYSGGDVSNYLEYLYDNTVSTHTGNLALKIAGVWTQLAIYDLPFGLYDTTATPTLLTKTQGTDAGFSPTPTQTSGGTTTFTLQDADALADGRYEWRARASDPSGTNAYGAFTAYRSVNINRLIRRDPYPQLLPQ
jgi:hypothetical protein